MQDCQIPVLVSDIECKSQETAEVQSIMPSDLYPNYSILAGFLKNYIVLTIPSDPLSVVPSAPVFFLTPQKIFRKLIYKDDHILIATVRIGKEGKAG